MARPEAGRVIVKDRGLNEIIRNVAAFDGKQVAVGIQGPEAGAVEHEGSELSNVELMVIHEFGAPAAGIPERSVIRATFDAKVKEWTAILAGVARQIYDTGPQSPNRLLGIVGEKVQADMIATINKGIPPELKAATVARKGSSKPLVDTAQLKQAITWTIR